MSNHESGVRCKENSDTILGKVGSDGLVYKHQLIGLDGMARDGRERIFQEPMVLDKSSNYRKGSK